MLPLFQRSTSFQVSAELNIPAKSHYRHLQILFQQLRVQDLLQNPIASLVVSVSKPGRRRQPPSTAMLLCWSLAQASYPFSRQQVQVTSCSWETIGYGPSARHSWGKKTLAVWTQVLLCQLASRSESGRGHSLYNNKEICCYVSVTHLNRLRDLFLKHGFLYIRSLQWRKNFQWLKHQKKKNWICLKLK